MVALLPIPIKNHNMPQKGLDEQWQTNRKVLNDVLRRGLQPLTLKHNSSAESRYCNVLCADGNFSHCKLVLVASLADCSEYSDIHHLKWHVSFWCECPKNELGDYVPPDRQHPQRDHNLYRTLSDANMKAANAKLWSCHVHRGINVIPHIPCIVGDLPKPDLLHTMQIGMLDHLQKWIFHFMKMHKRLDKYNAILLSMPAFNDLTPKNKSYADVSQSNGKVMKKLSRYLVGVATQSLRGGSPAQHPICNRAIEFIWVLLQFYMYARYKSHNNATLNNMEDTFHWFHTFKDDFLIGQARTMTKVKASALKSELMKKQKVDKETNAKTWTPCKKRREMNSLRDYISHKIDVSKELDADFNFPKIHLMSHWAHQICPYGAMQQYSGKRYEEVYKTNLKDSWNASNHNLNYLPQVITFQCCILCFELRQLNLQALAQLSEGRAAACIIFVSVADLAAPLRSQLYAKSEFMGPQNCPDGKHPDAMIKDCTALLDNTQAATHRVAIYRSRGEFCTRKSRNTTYISDEQQHVMELCSHHGIKVQHKGLEGKCISQICRCTGSQAPKRAWSVHWVLASFVSPHNTWNLG